MKISKIWGFIAIFAVSIPMLTSCKDDEPGNGDDADKGIVEIDGQKITKIGSYRISYDSKGRVTKVSTNNSYEVVEIDYSDGTIELDDEEGTIKFTKEGYLSEISMDYEDEDYGYTYKGSGTLKFTYKDNHLMSISSTYNEKETSPNGDVENWEGSESVTLKWSNNNLVSSNTKYKDYLNGELEEEENYGYTVSYGQQANKYLQFPISLADYLVDYDEIDVLIAIGLGGHGPAYLPTAVIDTEDNYTTSIDIDLNSNGSIDSESYNYETFDYQYTNVSTKGAFESFLNVKKKNVRNIFVTPSRRR